MNSARVMSVGIASYSRDEVRQAVVGLLQGTQHAAIAKVNAEFLLLSLSNKEFDAYLRSTRLNIADGIGVLWAARFLSLGTTNVPVARQSQTLWQAAYSLSTLLFFPRFCRKPIPERIPGVDALMTMLEAAQEADVSVYFLGATREINQKAREEIQVLMPGLKIAGGHDGYTDDWARVLREIDESRAGLLIVALGCPKQEFWIRDHLPDLEHVRVAVGEGGSLDFIAGDFRRAPKWVQLLNLEWFWRMFMNPNKSGSVSRARRIWNAVPVFIYQTVRWKLTHGPVAIEGGGSG